MMMSGENDCVAKKSLDGNPGNNNEAKDALDPAGSLIEMVAGLWVALLEYIDTALDGIKLDIKLAALSFLFLVVTVIAILVFLIVLWFLCMLVIFYGLTALHVSVSGALIVIMLLQSILLFICFFLCKRFILNISFRATRSAFSEIPENNKVAS